MKEAIRQFALDLGADAVGFAAAADYQSPLSPALESILPGVKSLVVMAYRELSTCESPNPQVAMNGRLDVMEFSRSCNYKLARYLERKGAKGATVPASYPMAMSLETKGSVGDVSLRHAAVAAGLGRFGRNNLVLHPEFGSRVIFTAVLTDLGLASDPVVAEDPCIYCDVCVEACPGRALDVEGKTALGKCLKHSQPYGIAASIRFWSEFAEASVEGRKAMLTDPHYWRLYQAGFIGFQYFCFRCMASCPVGQR